MLEPPGAQATERRWCASAERESDAEFGLPEREPWKVQSIDNTGYVY